MNILSTLEGGALDLIQGIKPVILLSYLALTAIIAALSIKRKKMTVHFQNLKREHLVLCEELDEKIALYSSLCTQSNLRARELTSHTLSVIQKHNVLSFVKNELKALAPVFNERPLQETQIGKKFKSVTETPTLDEYNYWSDFMSHFKLLYPQYLTNIKLKGIDVTEKELKLAALLRLGLDTKKIAGLLNLSPVSIKVFRHRLRKKLGLPEDVNLYNYLCHFDNHNN